MRRRIAAIPRGAAGSLRLDLLECGGRQLISIRLDDAEGMTVAGISIGAELLPEMIEALQDAERKLAGGAA